MGTALYIALEKQIPHLGTMIDGKVLSQAEEHLAEAAKRLGVRLLMEFFSTNEDELADLLGEDVADMDIAPAKWFSPRSDSMAGRFALEAYHKFD